MRVAMLSGMFALMRFTAIALSVLVFAVVFSVCGEAVACGGCAHPCCLRADRIERSRDQVVSRLLPVLREALPMKPDALSVAWRTDVGLRHELQALSLDPTAAQLRI